MDRIELLLSGIKANRHLETKWVLGMYTIGEYPFTDDVVDFKAYDIATNRDNGSRCYYNPQTNQFDKIEGVKALEAIIDYKGIYELKAFDLANLNMAVKTTGGNILANLYCLIIPFNNKIAYVNKKMSRDYINSLVETLAATDQISAAEVYNYCDCVNALAAVWAIATPTGSRKSMGVDANVIKKRDELLAKHSHELDNSVVMATIEKELVAMDKASFKGDVSEDFFISEKSMGTSRKKAHVIYGLEDGLGGTKPAIIKTALSEGTSAEHLPAAADSTRAASYSRGFLTAQGGELVNYLYRIFMNSKISQDDCGTKDGVIATVTKDNMKRYLGRYAFNPATKATFTIDEKTIAPYLDKQLLVRSPARCKAKPPNFCGHCTDTYFFTARETVHIETSFPGSTIMNNQMKAMHGRDFKVAVFNPSIHLT